MLKNFDGWNRQKKLIDARENSVYFHAGEIWWLQIGLNIGTESNGKSEQFARPILILKKFNKYSFLSLPLTTSNQRNNYRMDIGEILNQKASIILSQTNYRDSRRLGNKIGTLPKPLFHEIKKKISEMILN